MKGNSDFFLFPFKISCLLDHVVSSYNVKEKSLKDTIPELKSKKIANYNFLNSFWNRLVLDPFSFTQNPNATLTSIIESEVSGLAVDIQGDVLSEILQLPRNSKELVQALEETTKIFHEDYPYDFILEYKGERLGMFLLDNCINSAGEEKRFYRFNPHMKSFKGLY